MTQSEQGDGSPELVTSTTSNYAAIYNDKGSGATMDVGIWRPQPSDPAYFILGDYAQANHNQPTGVALVVKAVNDDPKRPLIKPPVGYTPVWNDHGTGTKQDCSIWYPEPPEGYVSIGSVANSEYGEPKLGNYACLRHDLVMLTDLGGLIWNDKKSGAKMDVSLYEIVGLNNAFVARAGYDRTGNAYKLKPKR